MTDTGELSTTQSDLTVLQDKGFILEKVVGEGSYAKVKSVHIFSRVSAGKVILAATMHTPSPRSPLENFIIVLL